MKTRDGTQCFWDCVTESPTAQRGVRCDGSFASGRVTVEASHQMLSYSTFKY
jgi:hypothetical protein